MNRKFLVMSMVAFAALSAGTVARADNRWRIKKASWSMQDEKNYSDFVAKFGESGCTNFSSCLKGSWNPYRASDDPSISYSSDCADLPYSLRAYFAWKNGLPFGYVNDVSPVGADVKDIRYSPNGNRVEGRFSVIGHSDAYGGFPNAVTIMKTMVDDVSTATFRIAPKTEDDETSTRFDDFYTPTLDRNGIHPGTAIYDPNGHVAVVYKVDDAGIIYYVDAHPDNSVTHGRYGEKFIRSRPGQGAGFRNFRPLKLENARDDGNGNLIGGNIVGATNSALVAAKLFSSVQYYGNSNESMSNWSQGRFVWKGNVVNYYDYVRYALAVGDLKFHPVQELQGMMAGLCQDLNDRVAAVQGAITNAVNRKNHPDTLPTNIYGTDGEWESFSTPSRDARLKTSFKEMHDRVLDFVAKYKNQDSSIVYTGANAATLKGDLLAAYNAAAGACSISYVNSNGDSKKLGFEDVRKRLFDLSFDPYHCVEYRWGAKGDELASCKDGADKKNWYNAEKYLRNQIDRRYDVKMDYSASQLLNLPTNVGVQSAPDVDLPTFLANGAATSSPAAAIAPPASGDGSQSPSSGSDAAPTDDGSNN